MNIEIVAGSPSKTSITYRVVLFLEKLLKEKTNHHIGIIDVRDWHFPALQQHVYYKTEDAPDELKPVVQRVFEAHAFILATPEYNGSYTPALKILFDHFPKQSRKAFGIVTASPGSMGGMRASQQMQLLINALFGIGSPYMLITPFVDKKFDMDGTLADPGFQRQIDPFIREFLWLAEKLHPEAPLKD